MASKYRVTDAYQAGVRMAHAGELLNASVMADYMGAPRTSVNPGKRPELLDACIEGYRTVVPDAEVAAGRRPSYSDQEIFAAVAQLAQNGDQLQSKWISEIVGLSPAWWDSPRARELEPRMREYYAAVAADAAALPPTREDVGPDWMEGRAMCGRCLNIAEESVMKKFPNTAYLCPECQRDYLQAVRRDEGVLAA